MTEFDDLHDLEISEVSRLLASRRISSVELTERLLRRIERVDPMLKSYALVTPELALAQAREADRMIGAPADPVAVARRAHCGEGLVFHRRRGHRVGHAAAPRLRAVVRCHRRAQVARGRGRAARQAAADRGRVRRPPPGHRGAAEPLARRPLVGRVVQWLRRGDGGRLVLRFARFRHRGFDPPAVGGRRRDRFEAHLGSCLASRLLRARCVTRSHRADVPQCIRCRDHAELDRGHRRGGPHHAARRRAGLPERRRSRPAGFSHRLGRRVCAVQGRLRSSTRRRRHACA